MRYFPNIFELFSENLGMAIQKCSEIEISGAMLFDTKKMWIYWIEKRFMLITKFAEKVRGKRIKTGQEIKWRIFKFQKTGNF